MTAASPEPLVMLGAGGHAKVCIELLRAQPHYELVGLLDADPRPRSVLGVPVLGPDDRLADLRRGGVKLGFVALGDNRARLAAAAQLAQHGIALVNLISPNATLSPSAVLGRGIAIMAGAVINAETRISDLAIVNTRASVDHDGDIGEASHLCPGSTLAGRVTIGRLALIGTGSSAIPGITVGENTLVGAGSCIVRDIPANSVAFGVPARIIRAHEYPPTRRD